MRIFFTSENNNGKGNVKVIYEKGRK